MKSQSTKVVPPFYGGIDKFLIGIFLILGCLLPIQTTPEPKTRQRGSFILLPTRKPGNYSTIKPIIVKMPKSPKSNLVGEDEASRPPHWDPKTWVPHKWGGTGYTEDEFKRASVAYGGKYDPEETRAIDLEKIISADGRGHGFTDRPDGQLYAVVQHHMRDLRRLGLPVNSHTATLTPLPDIQSFETTESPQRLYSRSSGDPSLQGYGPPGGVGTAPLLMQSASIFRYRGSLYPRSLNGHLHARIPLDSLEGKAKIAQKIAEKMDSYANKPEDKYKTHTRAEYQRMARSMRYKSQEMGNLTADLLDLLDLGQLKNHPGAILSHEQAGFNRATDPRSESRYPRQLGAFLCVLASGFVGAIGSLFTTSTANDVIRGRQGVLVQRMDQNTWKINQNEKDIILLNNTLNMLAHDAEITRTKAFSAEHDLFIAASMNHVDNVLSNLRRQVYGINEARRGKFSLDMVDIRLLKLALDELSRKALKQGFTLSISHPLELEGLGTTVVLEQGALHIIVSIPVLEKDPFDLYELVSVAMPMANTSEKSFLRFQPEKRYLAINGENTIYTELSSDELDQCKVYSARWYCTELIEYKISRKSCLSALYLNRPRDITSLCPTYLSSISSDILRLSDSQWLVLVDTGIHFKCTYLNGTKTAFKKVCKPGRVITIPAGCTANAPQFTVDRAVIDVSAQMSSIYVSHDSLEFDYLLGPGLESSPEEQLPDITQEVKRFLQDYNQSSLQALNLNTINQIAGFHRQLADMSSSGFAWPSLGQIGQQSIITIITVIVVCVVIFTVFKCVSLFWKTSPGQVWRGLTTQREYYPNPGDNYRWTEGQRGKCLGYSCSPRSDDESRASPIELRLLHGDSRSHRPTSYEQRKNRSNPFTDGQVLGGPDDCDNGPSNQAGHAGVYRFAHANARLVHAGEATSAPTPWAPADQSLGNQIVVDDYTVSTPANRSPRPSRLSPRTAQATLASESLLARNLMQAAAKAAITEAE